MPQAWSAWPGAAAKKRKRLQPSRLSPRPRLKDAPFDFSFSGLKSAAIRWIREHDVGVASEDDEPSSVVCDLAASFENAIVEQLLAPLPELAEIHRPHLVTASGGSSGGGTPIRILPAGWRWRGD